jgi:hypothetical protein
MSVTRFVIHFEMSALNAVAPENAVGVYVNAVDVEPEQEKKKPKIVREPQSSWNKQLNMKTKEVDVGRTGLHGRHLTHVPL